nr:hypothetical protein [Bacillus haynesii]
MGFLRNRIVGITLAGAVALGSAGTGSAAMETDEKKGRTESQKRDHDGHGWNKLFCNNVGTMV